MVRQSERHDLSASEEKSFQTVLEMVETGDPTDTGDVDMLLECIENDNGKHVSFSKGAIGLAIDAMKMPTEQGKVLLAAADDWARRLGNDNATEIEKHLIDQVVVSYLRYYDYDQRVSCILMSDSPRSNLAFWEARLTAAQRRYLRALETLARVSKLLKSSPIQINLAASGGQQVVQN